VRLLVVAEPEQRVERPARVADPAEAVVPVAAAAEPLREGGRGRGHDRAGGRVDEQLEHEETADDGLAPGAVVARAAAPRRPEATRPLEPALGVRAGRQDGGLL